MNAKRNTLNIPLKRKDCLDCWVIAGCILFTCTAAFFSLDFAIAFLLSTIVVLPMLWVFSLFKKRPGWFSQWGPLGELTLYFIVFVYIAIAKSLLVPALLAAVGHVLA